MPDLAVLGTGRACAGPVHGGLHPPSVPLHSRNLGHTAGRSSGAKGMRSWQNINSKDAAKTSGCSPAADATRPTTMSTVRPPAHFLRADRAHARIVKIDTTAARKQPGVLDIVTGADIVATGWKSPPVMSFFKGVGGSSLRIPFRAGLAHDRVRFVGEPVALVVADTEHHRSGRGRTDCDRIRGFAGDRRSRRRHRVRRCRHCTTTCRAISASTTNTAIARAPSRALPTPRTSFASSFARSAFPAIRWSRNPALRATTRRRSNSSSGCRPRAPATLKAALAQITGLGAEKFRIRSADVGGGFGVRNEIYPEFLAVMLAAKRTGRPVKWTGTRSETMSGDHHARAADLTGEFALDEKGNSWRFASSGWSTSAPICSERGPADQHGGGADQLGGEPLQHPRGARKASAGLHQHDADHGLSRRRPPERVVSLGAAGRGGRARDRDRFGQAAPPQPAAQGQPSR